MFLVTKLLLMFKVLRFTFYFTLVSASLLAQRPKVFSTKELKEDLQFLKKSFDTYNPALGVFHSKADYQRTYDSLYAAIDHEMTDLQFYPFPIKLAESVKEGHTLIGSSSDTVTHIFKGFLNGDIKYFPLSILKIKGKVKIWGNFSPDSTILRGDEIISINGRGISSIIDQIKSYMITDGDIQSSKEYKAINNFASSYYWFIDQPKSFKIDLISVQDNSRRQVEIPAISRSEMIEWRDKRFDKVEPGEVNISNVYEFIIKDDVAVLTLKSFNRQLKDRFKVKTKKLYNEIFTQLREQNIENLIIDVRNNTGGRREYAWDLLPYIMKTPIKGVVYQDVSWKGKTNNNKFPKQHRSYFKGQIYVLANPVTFSNGSVVTVYAKEYGEAIVIGQETGSRHNGFAAGSRQIVYLPNTHVRIGIPRYLFLHDQKHLKHNVQNRGVIPDYPIEYTFEDLVEKRDLEMQKAQELIKQ